MLIQLTNVVKLLRVHPDFSWGSCCSIVNFCVNACRSLFVLLSFFCWPLCCWTFFDFHILTTALVSSNSSFIISHIFDQGPGGSMSQASMSCQVTDNTPITNTAWVRARHCKLQKGCTRLVAASDKVYQLLAHGRWFSPGTPASSTTKAGRHEIVEILMKVALNTINQIIFYQNFDNDIMKTQILNLVCIYYIY